MKGQALIFVLIIMVLGFILVAALLVFLNISLIASGKGFDWSREYFSASAAVEEVIADLLQGKDALGINYTYIDPGAGSELYPLPPESNWKVQLSGVEGGSIIRVNWAFTPETEGEVKWRIRLFEGTDIPANLLAEGEGDKSPGNLMAYATKGDIYTVVFYNEGDVALYSQPFSQLNGWDNTWISAKLSNYVIPSVSLNGLDVTLSISSPADERPPVPYIYIDPGTDSGLNPLPPGAQWLIQLWGLEEGSIIRINWAFTPKEGEWEIKVFEGTDITAKEVAEGEGDNSPGYLQATLAKGGIYTVIFRNDEEDINLFSKPFNSIDGGEYTWIRAQLSGREYMVTSQAGSTILKVYIRQIPGPGPSSPPLKQRVVEWWE